MIENKIFNSQDLHNLITNALYNGLCNYEIRNFIVEDQDMFSLIKLQISNLFFLEKDNAEIQNVRAFSFAQIISNLVGSKTAFSKINEKPLENIYTDYTAFLTSVANLCNISTDVITLGINIDNNKMEILNDKIIALNDFNATQTSLTNLEENLLKDEMNLTNTMTNDENKTDHLNDKISGKINEINYNEADFPKHPTTDPRFYPYLTKPQYMPMLRKILSWFIISLIVSFVAFHIGNLFIKTTIENEVYQFGIGTTSWLKVFLFSGIYFCFFIFLNKKTEIVRDTYHISYFWLFLIALSSIFIFFDMFVLISARGIAWDLSAFLKINIGDITDEMVAKIQLLPNFKIAIITTYIFGFFVTIIALLCLIMSFLNPKINRSKILKADIEYQNAITAIINGKNYTIDESLFEENITTKKKSNTFFNFKKNKTENSKHKKT